MREEAVVVLRLDAATLPAESQKAEKSLKAIGATGETSARQTAAAMRMLPAQMTDVATQLAGGQNPLLILLQQGGQVKDSFGGIGPAIKGIGAAITPTALGIGALAAAVGTLAVAAHEGAAQDEALRNTITLTGNASALTASRVQLYAEQVAAASQQTVGGAREIVMALASSGQVSGRVLNSMAEAVARVADVTGEDSKKVAADFAGMANGVAKWAQEHNKAWNFITVEQYKYIRRLEEQGQLEKAMIYTSQLAVQHLAEQQKNLGYLESGWNAVKKAASGAWDAILGVGKEQTTRQQLDVAMERLKALGDNLQPKAKAAAEQRVQFLKEQLKLENQAADAASRNAAANQAAIEAASKPPQFPFGAIRGAVAEGQYQYLKSLEEDRAGNLIARNGAAQEQARQDFLRSEKAFYDELEKQRQDELKKAMQDPLGEFLTEQVLPAEKRRDDQRLTQNAAFLQSLQDANDRAAIELIEDERARGEALIALDRQIAQRRLTEQGVEGGARTEALRQLDEQGLLRRRLLERDLRASSDKAADEAGRAVYDDVKGALSAAFQDSQNPALAFARGLANAIFTRLTASIADALATAAVGSNGRGGALGELVGVLSSFNGGLAIDSGGYGITPADGSIALPTRGGMASGTNYVPRDMIVKVHKGEKITPAKYNDAAGGGRPPLVINNSPTINVDARADAAQIARIASDASAQGVRALVEELRAQGKL